MPRVRKGSARRKANKRVLKAVKGHRGSAGRLLRLAKEAGVRALTNAYTDRKLKKRTYRQLWILRISAACANRGTRYSRFMDGINKASIGLNRKMLSEIAIADPAAFDALVEKAEAAL